VADFDAASFRPEKNDILRSLPFFIGLRYTRAKRRNGFVSFISLASMLGIALGITALITVMSVMNGFQKEVRAGMISVASHIQILNFEKGLADWPKLLAETRACWRARYRSGARSQRIGHRHQDADRQDQ